MKTAVLHTDGVAGLSGIDAQGSRRMCAFFLSDMHHSLALLTRILSTELVCPDGVVALMFVALCASFCSDYVIL